MIKYRLNEWLKRYLPPEIAGTITALLSAGIAHIYIGNHIAIAYYGSLGEAIGFYSTVLFQHLLIVSKNKKITFPVFIHVVKNIVLEFGFAGLIDGLLLRPFFMYTFPLILKDFTLGILIGKITGDITFYILVIISYEIKKQHQRI
jgi:hypothetical protein